MAVNDFVIGGANSIRDAAIRTAVPQPTLGPALGQLGAAGFDVAQVLQAERDENDRRRDALTSASALSNARIAMEEQAARLDPTSDSYEADLDAALAEARDDALANANLTDDDARAQLELDLNRAVTAHKLTSIAARRDALEDQAIFGRSQEIDRTLAAIRDDPDGFDAQLALFGQAAARYNQSIRPDRLAVLNAEFADAATLAQIEGLANAGRYSEARAVLKAHEGELDGEKVRAAGALVRQIEDGHKRARLEAGARSMSDVDIAISGADDVQTLTAARDRIEQLYRAELITPAQRSTLHRRADARKRAIVGESRGLTEAAVRMQAGLGLNSPDEARRYYEKVVEPEIAAELAGLPAEQQAAHVARRQLTFARRSGFVAPPVASLLKRAEGIDNAQQLALAAETVQQHREHARAAMARETVGPRVEAALAYHRAYDVPLDQAAQMAIDDARRAPEVFDRRAEEFKGVAIPGEDLIQGAVPGSTAWFSADAIIPPEVERDAEAAFRAAYLRSGNVDQARAQAEATIKHRYGVTNVGGGGAPVVMEIAPEPFVPHVAELGEDYATRLIDEDVRKHLAEGGLTIPEPPAGMEGSPDYFLQADGQTRIEATTGRPSWKLLLRDETGGYYQPVVTDENGNETLARYAVPLGENAKALDTARKAETEKRLEAMNTQIQAELARLVEAGQGPNPQPRDRTKLDELVRKRNELRAELEALEAEDAN